MFTRISIAALAAVIAATSALAQSAMPPTAQTLPAVFGHDPVVLAATRQRIAARDPAIMPAANAFIREADKLLSMKPASVMDKTRIADSGDKHDYFSIGTYFWPDPSKPNGKPYINKDGQANPDNKKGTDFNAFSHTCTAVETLGLAYYFTANEAYAQKAAQLATTWFLAPETRMNPNFNHAQAVPGKNAGRSSGVLDAHPLANLTDGLALIAASPAWPAASQAAMRAWLEAYYKWMTTAPNALRETAAANNHGTWCNAQLAHIELALGKTDAARARVKRELTARIASQIKPDGEQPEELRRTRSYHYSLYNLEPLFLLAQLGDRVGWPESWSYATKDKRSLRAALAYVAPYVDPDKTWPHKDIEKGGIERARAHALLRVYLAHQADPELKSLYEKFASLYAKKTDRQLLFLPAIK